MLRFPFFELFLGVPIHELSHDLQWQCSDNSILELPIGSINDRHRKREGLQLKARILLLVAIHFVEDYVLAMLELLMELLHDFLENPTIAAPRGKQLDEFVATWLGGDSREVLVGEEYRIAFLKPFEAACESDNDREQL